MHSGKGGLLRLTKAFRQTCLNGVCRKCVFALSLWEKRKKVFHLKYDVEIQKQHRIKKYDLEHYMIIILSLKYVKIIYYDLFVKIIIIFFT